MSCYFFFFQAEDGIRDLYVTGVQTCALPISSRPDGSGEPPYVSISSAGVISHSLAQARRKRRFIAPDWQSVKTVCAAASQTRSEERRVGKECRSRWAQYQ